MDKHVINDAYDAWEALKCFQQFPLEDLRGDGCTKGEAEPAIASEGSLEGSEKAGFLIELNVPIAR